MEELGQERNHIIQELAEVRKKLFAMIYRECNCIVWNGESISPSAAAAYVQENEEKLGYIPGKVRMYAPLPLTFSELTELYRSNGMISDSEENELEHDLPDSKSLLSPMDFEIYYGKLPFDINIRTQSKMKLRKQLHKISGKFRIFRMRRRSA